MKELFRVLLFLDILWVFLYAGILIAVYSVPTSTFDMRGAVFRFGTHVGTTLSLMYVTYQKKLHKYPLAFVFAFETFRDVLNTVEIAAFSNLQAGLYVATIVCGSFQIGISFISLINTLLF